MPPPMIATRTPPSTRPLNASKRPAITIANSTKPVTNWPVEIVCAAPPKLENGSCAQQVNAAADRLKTIAGELQKLVGQFKIKDE